MTDYTQKLSDQGAEFLKQRDAAFLKHESDVADLNQRYAESAKTILKEIEVHKAAVEKLVGVIGNLGVTSGYQKVANYATDRLVAGLCALLIQPGRLIRSAIVFKPSTLLNLWSGVGRPFSTTIED